MRKPKVLCLHGGGSNNEVTQFQTAALKLSSRANCHYLHAPHEAKRCYPGLDRFVEGPFYTWSESSGRDQWDKSLESIAEYCLQQGPFEIVFGFSQGAAIVTEFSLPRVWKNRFGFTSRPWKSAILACGGGTSNITFDNAAKIDIPSLHIMGSVDPYIEESRDLLQRWSSVSCLQYVHQKGHEIDMMILMREEGLAVILNEFLQK